MSDVSDVNTNDCSSSHHSSLSPSNSNASSKNKTVRFNSTLEQSRYLEEERAAKMNNAGRPSDSEAKTRSPKDTNSDKASVNVLSSDSPGQKSSNVKKGTCAKFLRHNPRFINEPICQVLPNESSRSVGECLSWCSQANTDNLSSSLSSAVNGRNVDGAKSSQCRPDKFYNSTCHSTYLPPRNDRRPHPLQKHHPSPKADGIAPLINEQQQAAVKERISYSHQYNSRADPNEPIRGKLHGSFVWELQKATDMSSRPAQPSKQ